MTPVATLAGGLAARADLRLPIVLGAVATMIIGAVGWVALRFVASVGGAHNET